MNRRIVPEVSGGAMADIAFMLLIFFLVATTMDMDKGILRKLSVYEENPPPSPPSHERDVMLVWINSENKLMVEGELVSFEDLRSMTKKFVLNSERDEKLPEMENKQIPFFGNWDVSKAIISLQNDRNTSYETYIRVQNELTAAYNELRDELSTEKFGVKFENLPPDKQAAVKDIFPQRISEAEPKKIAGR